jgi:heat shock protein HslJ
VRRCRIKSPATVVITLIPTNNVSGGDQIDTQWVLESINEGGTEPPSFSTVLTYLEFRENGEAGDSGGCNTFSMQYEVQHVEISFGPIASTKMSCTIDILQEEQMFFDSLESANRYEISGDTLRIWYVNEQNVLKFSRITLGTPAPPAP